MKWYGWGNENIPDSIMKNEGFWSFNEKFFGRTKEHFILKPEKNVKINESNISSRFLKKLSVIISPERITQDEDIRLEHAAGRRAVDMIKLREGHSFKAPDLVVYPNSSEEIKEILQLAEEYDIKIIPFGGGTNVVCSIEVDENYPNGVVTLDMKEMNRLVSLDKKNMQARFECGILGPELEKKLNAHGLSFGHFPDSFEFSTLGGWIATRSSGAQSDGYGNIEDLVVALDLITPIGKMSTINVARQSIGPELKQIVFGSEGILGIITEAELKIHEIPEEEVHIFLFPDFLSGAFAIQEANQHLLKPSIMRLSDAEETKLIMSLKQHKSNAMRKFFQKKLLQTLEVLKKKSYKHPCFSLIGFTGPATARRGLVAQTKKIFKKYGAIDLGQKLTKDWTKMRFDYPYVLDIALGLGLAGDIAETCISWTNLESFYNEVVKTIKPLMQSLGMEGYLGCHLSHSYRNGACLYFTYGTYIPGQDRNEFIYKIKNVFMDIVMKYGGAVSHHHAVGTEHLPWVEKVLDDTSIATLISIKNTLDPKNILNPGKLIPERKAKWL